MPVYDKPIKNELIECIKGNNLENFKNIVNETAPELNEKIYPTMEDVPTRDLGKRMAANNIEKRYIDFAAALGRKEILLFLIKEERVPLKTPTGSPGLLWYALCSKSEEIITEVGQYCENFKDNTTKMHIAAALGDLSTLRTSYAQDVDLNKVVNANGITLPMIAAYMGEKDVLKFLLDTAKCGLEASEGAFDYQTIHFAIAGGNLEILKEILDRKPDLINTKTHGEKETLLHVAITHEHREIVNYLIKKKSEMIKFKTQSEESPLHLAMRDFVKDEKIAKNLINYLEHKPSQLQSQLYEVFEGDSPLFLALKSGKTETAEYLIRNFLETLKFKNAITGETVLHRAARSKCDLSIIEIILNLAPHLLEVEDITKRTALDYAIEKKFEIAEYLLLTKKNFWQFAARKLVSFNKLSKKEEKNAELEIKFYEKFIIQALAKLEENKGFEEKRKFLNKKIIPGHTLKSLIEKRESMVKEINPKSEEVLGTIFFNPGLNLDNKVKSLYKKLTQLSEDFVVVDTEGEMTEWKQWLLNQLELILTLYNGNSPLLKGSVYKALSDFVSDIRQAQQNVIDSGLMPHPFYVSKTLEDNIKKLVEKILPRIRKAYFVASNPGSQTFALEEKVKIIKGSMEKMTKEQDCDKEKKEKNVIEAPPFQGNFFFPGSSGAGSTSESGQAATPTSEKGQKRKDTENFELQVAQPPEKRQKVSPEQSGSQQPSQEQQKKEEEHQPPQLH